MLLCKQHHNLNSDSSISVSGLLFSVFEVPNFVLVHIHRYKLTEHRTRSTYTPHPPLQAAVRTKAKSTCYGWQYWNLETGMTGNSHLTSQEVWCDLCIVLECITMTIMFVHMAPQFWLIPSFQKLFQLTSVLLIRTLTIVAKNIKFSYGSLQIISSP